MKKYTIQDVLNCLNTAYTDVELSYSDLLILAQSAMPIIDNLQEKYTALEMLKEQLVEEVEELPKNK